MDYENIRTASAFDVMAADEAEQHEAKLGNRAIIAARTRVTAKYAKYVGNAKTASEVEERIDLIKTDLLATVVAACSEHDFNTKEEVQTVLSTVTDELRKIATKQTYICGECDAARDSDEDISGQKHGAEGCDGSWFAENGSDRESAVKTADLSGSQNAGDSSQGDSGVDVAKDTQPQIDTSRVPASGLDKIDVGSKVHPNEHQDIDKVPTDAQLNANGIDAARNDKTTDVVDADKPIGTEQVGGPTSTHSEMGNQANPVTSKWRLADGQ